jgi:hypothetical protein
MSLVHGGVERLLLLLLAAVRILCLLQGLAFATATAAVLAAAPPDSPPWLRAVGLTAAMVSATFFITGALLAMARRWPVSPSTQDSEPLWPWRVALGLSLVGVALLAALAASNLPSLWVMIGTRLDAIDFWSGVTRPDPYGGIVLLPIMLALFVPVLVSGAALLSIGYPLALLLLMPARRPPFPALLVMGSLCQAGLVLAGWLAADMLGRLAEQAQIAMDASGEAEVLRVSADLRGATEILSSTATALAVPMLIVLAWALFLRPGGRAATHFAERGPRSTDGAPW